MKIATGIAAATEHRGLGVSSASRAGESGRSSHPERIATFSASSEAPQVKAKTNSIEATVSMAAMPNRRALGLLMTKRAEEERGIEGYVRGMLACAAQRLR